MNQESALGRGIASLGIDAIRFLDLRVKTNFLNRINAILVVQSSAKKHFASR
jgi:hypothetical protein